MMRLDTRMARGARDALGTRLCLLAGAAAATALAAGCATAAAPSAGAGAGAGAGTATATKAASSPAPSRTTPVPTTTAGPPSGSVITCAGWPAHVTQGRPPASFVPTAAIRCLVSDQMITGKGEWETATLEKSTDNLATLVEVLLQPSVRVQPGVYCPEFAVIPPQVLLISSTGKQLILRLPLGACGIINARVLTTLASMSWQPVSVRLISKVAPAAAPRTFPGASIGPGTPKALRTGAPAAAS